MWETKRKYVASRIDKYVKLLSRCWCLWWKVLKFQQVGTIQLKIIVKFSLKILNKKRKIIVNFLALLNQKKTTKNTIYTQRRTKTS